MIKTQMKAFVLAFIAWAVIGSMIVVGFEPSVNWSTALFWFFVSYFLCLIDLYALYQTLKNAVRLMALDSDRDTNLKPALVVQVMTWGILKMGALGGIMIFLWVTRKEAPSLPVITGLATLLFVPLVGGFVWSQKEIRYA